MVRIGAHVSSSKSLDLVFDRAKEIGAETVQFFLNSPRSWSKKIRSDEEVKKFLNKKNLFHIYQKDLLKELWKTSGSVIFLRLTTM